MDSAASETAVVYLPDTVRYAVKILITGHFGVGKTTMVGSLSEVAPLHTEETLSQAGQPIDDLTGVAGKATTTVAIDFGRLTLTDTLVLYLFGTPGQPRFTDLWHTLAHGAMGTVVLVDARRLDQSFPLLDRVEDLGLPYAVAANTFDGAPRHDLHELRRALALSADTPLVDCDVRDRQSCAHAVIALVEHLLVRHPEHP
ncbi:ATP/GTP-binding protein [Umezawaea sp. Da 62-37]|uniref:GTP-binding protein n=1 Tax=Umezawaea sp. Da 62-37 TaxID=3075927 RepID=UPI0028F6F623|nr:ATP/GTP-binding protein [Umezawaea sp. Da 62-37]WNV85018.1 ATP/GTP-binding protein [Umezawaea sp. Da 62-37]